jgi:maltose alpha-D-glucosyltransferase/alpha-amylase
MNWMERMIRVRKETPEIGWGDYRIVESKRDDVLIVRYEWQGKSVVVVHSFTADPIELRFRAAKGGEVDGALLNVISSDHSYPESDGQHCVLLEPYGYRWFRVKAL